MLRQFALRMHSSYVKQTILNFVQYFILKNKNKKKLPRKFHNQISMACGIYPYFSWWYH